MKTGTHFTERIVRERDRRRRWGLILAWAAVVGSAAPLAHAQGGDWMAFAAYENPWRLTSETLWTPPNTIGNPAENAAIYQGHVRVYSDEGSTTKGVPIEDTSHTLRLAHAAFGQPLGGQTFFGASYYLGEEVQPPEGTILPIASTPTISPATHAFFVPTAVNGKVFTGDVGLVSITWQTASGPRKLRYVIADQDVSPPVKIYHNTDGPTTAPTTDLPGGGRGFLVDFADAPTSLTIHYNSQIRSESLLYLDADRQLRAQYSPPEMRENQGKVVMHYDEDNGTQFAGVRIIKVCPFSPDPWASILVLAGQTLAPSAEPLRGARVSTPTLARVPEDPLRPHLFQYPKEKDPPVRDQAFVTRPTTDRMQAIVYWKHTGDYPGLEWPYELASYSAGWPTALEADWKRIYHTGPIETPVGQGGPPVGDDSPESRLPAGLGVDLFLNDQVSTSDIWEETVVRQIRANWTGATPGRILVRLDDFGSTGESTLEYVEIHRYLAPMEPVHVSDRLEPNAQPPGFKDEYTRVTRGHLDQPRFIYQHTQSGPYNGTVFAVRPTKSDYEMELFFRREGKKSLIWPYEMHRYTATWPPDAQICVRRTSADVPELKVALPEELETDCLQFYQEWKSLAGKVDPLTGSAHLAKVVDNGRSFVCDLSGKTESGDLHAVLKYQLANGSDWVGFQVVRCVHHNDSRYFPGGAEYALWSWKTGKRAWVGTEITDPYHKDPNRSGYIYHLPNVPPEDREDHYDPQIYEGPIGVKTGQIFPVFPGHTLEVWWSNETTHGLTSDRSYPIYWPSKVVRYEGDLPDSMEPLVIAGKKGWHVYTTATQSAAVYYQNNKDAVGYKPNYEHAGLMRPQVGDGLSVYALRCDLNQHSSDPNEKTPYVLAKYRDPDAEGDPWRYKVFSVVATDDAMYPTFSGLALAGSVLQRPWPLFWLPGVPETEPETSRDGTYGMPGHNYWRDRDGTFWARSAHDNGGSVTITMKYFYPMQAGFIFPPELPESSKGPGDVVAWLDRLGDLGAAPPADPGQPGTPVDYAYTTTWPGSIPKLEVGQTLVKRSGGLPDIMSQASCEIVYESLNHSNPHKFNVYNQNAKLIDPLTEREVPLASLPTGEDAVRTKTIMGKRFFVDLPPHLFERVSWDPTSRSLELIGWFYDFDLGEDMLMPNILSERDKEALLGLSNDIDWQTAVNVLYAEALEPIELTSATAHAYGKALIGKSAANGGYVTLAMNNHVSCVGLTVELYIIQVVSDLYTGEIKVFEPLCCFDERQTVQLNADFGGEADRYVFDWECHADSFGGNPPPSTSTEWLDYPFVVPPGPDPVKGEGAIDVLVAGPGPYTLTDNWFRCRYRRETDPDEEASWSLWTQPKPAYGWIKRVLGDINPYTQKASGGGLEGAEGRFAGYREDSVDTIVDMIAQAGPPWMGDVPFNCDAQVLQEMGLIEIYETVLNRGKELSIDAAEPFSNESVSVALLLAAGRIADLYMLLGNEAYADAADPTIAFGTEDGTYGKFASSIHCFMNQTASLLEEELDLLRGRDDSKAPGVSVPPLYNRLIPNFTGDIAGGEVAYVLNYNISDQNGDGTIDESDALRLYPQGHGDAWGHYLTAVKRYYNLLRHPNYEWVVRGEAVSVGGQPVMVDFLDERKFAKAAAAKAKTGAEVVNLTYRQAYVEDPDGQWQGYKDSDTGRQWGLAEWASRAGQGAYFDWVAANAILPTEDAAHTGIQKIDRQTVAELREIPGAFGEIQSQLDEADIGLNPLGLSKNVLPFDIDPAQVAEGETHFEQVYNRALIALNNAVRVFDFATNCTQLLRRQADSLEDFQNTVDDREADFKSRLIEIFGRPYTEDIGPDGAYPAGYDGPDYIHYDYVDESALLLQLPGGEHGPTQTYTITFKKGHEGVDHEGNIVYRNQDNETTAIMVPYNVSLDGFGMVKPDSWTNRRPVPGEIQQARSRLLQQYGKYQKAAQDYSNLVGDIDDMEKFIDERIKSKTAKLGVLSEKRSHVWDYNNFKTVCREVELLNSRLTNIVKASIDVGKEAVPGSWIGGFAFGGDLMAPVRATLSETQQALAIASAAVNDAAVITQERMDVAKEHAYLDAEYDLLEEEEEWAVREMIAELEGLINEEPVKRLEVLTQAEACIGTMGEYQAALARGLRLLEDRTRFRNQTAAKVQDYRYKDMAFRVFRNDALQKYRAQFDMASRYVYLAAKAYDYETNLMARDKRAGEFFLTNIVRARALGSIIDELPQAVGGVGDPGLADAMARMKLNWDLTLEGQLGFNNPQTETNRFSLRSEFWRCQSDEEWRRRLEDCVTTDLLTLPEFKRYCRLFYPHLDTEPGIVIDFGSEVNFARNFFGLPLWPGDSAYDSTNFATKIRSVGVWFSDYDALTSMSHTPRVYLIPVGYDIMRSPTGDTGETREWRIMDQKLPVPFPVGHEALARPDWIPMVDTLSEEYAAIRKYSSFRAYHDSGFNPAEMTYDSRLIGRSVWNTRWVLIIPAGTLYVDRAKAMEWFINGVTDIKVFFQTYAYSGN